MHSSLFNQHNNGHDKEHDWQLYQTGLINAQLQTWRGFVSKNMEMVLLY